jgi:6-phosphogluconate dehydrogenase
LGVMGENLAKNIASKGYTLTVYNRTAERTRSFTESVKGVFDIKPAYSLEEFVRSLERPRKIILMVQAGRAVDSVLTQLAPVLDKGDMVFDCGNSYFRDTERRQLQFEPLGVRVAGVGVSGGEEGALKGPSIMFGGDHKAYMETRSLWEDIAAKYSGEPCAGYMGKGGAGHFVKMVHNGIEYAVLQLIAETYDILHTGLGRTAEEIAGMFREWLRGENSSYLLEIAVDALSVIDEETQQPLVELVLDKAEQKGTGRWAVQTAAELGVPTPSIDAAVSARNLSSLKDKRVRISRHLWRKNPANITRRCAG